MLRDLGFKDVTHYKSQSGNYPECIQLATIEILNQYPAEPILLLQDDVEFTGEADFIMDTSADAIYFGLSVCGGSTTRNIDEGSSKFEPYSIVQSRVMNMLTAHAILYISSQYKKAVIDIFTTYMGQKYYDDVLLSRLQPQFLILANKKPSFYQSSRFNPGGHVERCTRITLP